MSGSKTVNAWSREDVKARHHQALLNNKWVDRKHFQNRAAVMAAGNIVEQVSQPPEP